ncbi:unnamed protein product [Chironomus riparius]|uniref:Serpin domain-containing protein n=1 Tax=Chironomus riparius TaxID=315576 RepID=A0A9N9RUY9_9DIPT|nr:unnamed protein product [Chironomus riparius]
MSGKIAFILFCAVVIIECEPQYGNSYGFQFLPILQYSNNDNFAFTSPNNKYKERVSLTRPTTAQNTGSLQDRFAPNQEHFGSPDRKETNKPETQSLDQKFDSNGPRKPTGSPILQKKPSQSSYSLNEYPQESLATNQDSTDYRRDRFSSTVQPNKYQTDSIQPGQASYGSHPFNSQPISQKNPNLYIQSEKDKKFENYNPITEFSWKLFKNVNNPQQPNFVISPLSPQHLLSYLASGAEGVTKKEIVDAIQYNSPSQLNSLISTMLKEPGNKELQLASALFVSNRIGVNPEFQKKLAENTKIVSTDFSDTEQFNRVYSKWVAEKTKGALSNVRIKPEPSTRMLLSSAVYFKGEWIFKLNSGGIDDFYVTENNPVRVPMMKLLKKLPYGKLQNGNLGEWIALPYNSNDSMVIILPRKGLQLDDLIQQLNVQEVFDSMNIDNYGNVTLTLPKFKVESRSSLVNPLKQMGIKQLFTTNSQLPNIFSSPEPLSISNVLQQASLEINEEGSIATSLTAFAVVALSFSPPTPDVEFKVDRPFIAMIIDRKNSFPYFVAKISNPAV